MGFFSVLKQTCTQGHCFSVHFKALQGFPSICLTYTKVMYSMYHSSILLPLCPIHLHCFDSVIANAQIPISDCL